MKLKRLLGIVTVIAIVGVLGTGVYWRIGAHQADEEADPASETAGDNGPAPATSALQTFNADVPVPVEGTAVVKDTMVLTVTGSGEAVSPVQIELTPQVAGPIRNVLVRENSYVQAGQVLVELDTVDLALNVRDARDNLARAQNSFDRLMLGSDSIRDPATRARFEANARINSGLTQAETRLEREILNLGKSKVVSPITGRVADLLVVPGQYVSGGTPLLTVFQVDPIQVDVDVLEGDIGLVEVGRFAEIEFTGLQGEEFRGRITSINPIVERASGAARVTVTVPNPGGRILPGMYANATVDATRLPDRIMVPRSAIVERQGRDLVFVFAPENGHGEFENVGRAMWQYVARGYENNTHVELVLDPEDPNVRVLEPGEIVLTNGHTDLPHQGLVRLVQNALLEGGRPSRR